MQSVQEASSIGAAVIAAQSTFRRVMDATARPGSIEVIPEIAGAPAPLSQAAAAIALTLFDHDTPVWMDAPLASSEAVAAWLRFNTGCPIVADQAQCTFALVADASAAPPFESFALGTPDYPDRSTTLILQAATLTGGPELVLSGPGIRGTASLRVGGLPEDFVMQHAANRALFPRGVDLLLVADNHVAALPRTTIVTRA
ncbi:phosphonate C-P lyase system protein PhnH [Bradyrhizobium sp. LHD-71]|uniref:phosphonate C-P lyase system protein PhnH n=1 Tax=Bradyrhizobium sp. LHD-71 TaxID=3072141 RepID=UPI00280E8FEA|nr:phosphonate C-P lyase system protein PhnH [Bradyrhizobium sp. LHD-71]MDQ8726526.1 phosphonate C-P lyase system protein PhnH [Bradyrhizobium sp. LHD-71]